MNPSRTPVLPFSSAPVRHAASRPTVTDPPSVPSRPGVAPDARAAGPSPAGSPRRVPVGPTSAHAPAPVSEPISGSGAWSTSPTVQFKLSLLAAQIAEALYTARLLQTSTDPAVLALPFTSLSAELQAIYREAAEVAIRRMDPYMFSAASTNALRIAPQFDLALERYHRTLALSVPLAPAPEPSSSPSRAAVAEARG